MLFRHVTCIMQIKLLLVFHRNEFLPVTTSSSHLSLLIFRKRFGVYCWQFISIPILITSSLSLKSVSSNFSCLVIHFHYDFPASAIKLLFYDWTVKHPSNCVALVKFQKLNQQFFLVYLMMSIFKVWPTRYYTI